MPYRRKTFGAHFVLMDFYCAWLIIYVILFIFLFFLLVPTFRISVAAYFNFVFSLRFFFIFHGFASAELQMCVARVVILAGQKRRFGIAESDEWNFEIINKPHSVCAFSTWCATQWVK